MKTALLALIALFSFSSCEVAKTWGKQAGVTAAHIAVSYGIAYAVRDYVEANPQSRQIVLDLSALLKDGDVEPEEAELLVENYLSVADLPRLEREVLSQALWDSVDPVALKLEPKSAEYISTVGRYAEIGAQLASSGSK